MHEDLSAEIRHLSERLNEAPDSRLFAPLADAYRKSGQVDRAIELCEEGLGKFPDYASAHVILGKCFYDKGATERSKAEFDRVLELDSENMVALKFLGDIMQAENRYDEARKYFDRLLAIDPMNEEVLRLLKEMEKDFHARDIDLEDEGSVRKVQQPREMATMTLAGIYASQGYYAKALKMYRDILAVEPDNKDAG
ncbi:MAG TPA: tetratricopeptide repeat protein, partial [Candidatus Krumholzibacterium sp.]|nr:tetratricopeptide repeat protein [Candidatus Krumholzibacterium sp.]